jgi:hypothetical protein
MRTIRPAQRSFPRLIALVLIALVAVACASGGASLSAVGNSIGDTDGGQRASGEGVDVVEPYAPNPDEGPAAPGDGVGIRDDARIIRTGSMELEVDDVTAAVRAARDAVRGFGGYIGASRTFTEDEQPYAEITYRIPADRWEEALDALRGLSGQTRRVISEQTQAVEVTGQVLDLEARIRNLRASETALQGIAEGATRISDVLEIQAQLTNVRGQIEQLEAQLGDLEDRAGYATLTVAYRLPVVATAEIQAKGWDPALIAGEATASLVGLLQALAGAGIWFAIVWLPIIVMLGIGVALVAWFLRRLGVLDRVDRTRVIAAGE